MNINKILKDNSDKFLGLITIFLTLGPMFYIARYSIYSNEDFLIATKCGLTSKCRETIPFLEFFHNMYLEETGSWFSATLAYVINPFRISGYKFLRIQLIVAFLLVIGLLSKCILLYYKKMGYDTKEAYRSLSLTLFLLLFFKNYSEIYFWWTGVIFYEIPVIFFLIGIIFLLKEENESIVENVFTVISLVLASGGALVIGVLEMYSLLIFAINEKRTKKLKLIIISMICVIVGILFNCLSLGTMSWISNFTKDSPSAIKSFLFSLFMIDGELKQLFQENGLLFGGIVSFMMGLRSSTNKTTTLVRHSISTIGGAVFVLFPITYARRYWGIEELPERCEWLVDIILVIGCINIFRKIGEIVAKNKSVVNYKRFIWKVSLFFMAVSIVYIGIKGEESFQVLSAMKGIEENTIKSFSDKWSTVYYICEKGTGDLIIEIEIPECEYVHNPKMGVDKHNKYNVWVSNFYGLNSIELHNLSKK